MGNNDTLEIMQDISDARNELTKAIGELHAGFSEFKGNVEARVSEVEEKQDKAENRQWIHSITVAAATFIHHDLGQYFHWRF